MLILKANKNEKNLIEYFNNANCQNKKLEMSRLDRDKILLKNIHKLNTESIICVIKFSE